MDGLFQYTFDPVDDTIELPPRCLGLHCASVAVQLLETMYLQYDNCYKPTSTLRSLYINKIKLEEETCLELAYNLSHNKRLIHLVIEDGGIPTEKAMKELAYSLKRNISLIWLKLDGHQHINENYIINKRKKKLEEKKEKERLMKKEKDDFQALYGLTKTTKTTTIKTTPLKKTKKSDKKLEIYSNSPIVGPICELIDYNKARSCRSEITEPVMFRALSLSNNGLRTSDVVSLSQALKEDVVLTALDISNNTIGLEVIGHTLLDYGLSGLTTSDIEYNTKRVINWNLRKDIQMMIQLIMNNKKTTTCSINELLNIKNSRKSSSELNKLIVHISKYLPRLSKIGEAGMITNELLELETKNDNEITWKELLRFLHYIQLPDLSIVKKDERTGKEAQVRNQGIISLNLSKCTVYKSGKIKKEENESKVRFSLSLKRLFQKNNHLVLINLSSNRLDDSTSKSITNGMLHSSTITCLILSSNRFSSKSVSGFMWSFFSFSFSFFLSRPRTGCN